MAYTTLYHHQIKDCQDQHLQNMERKWKNKRKIGVLQFHGQAEEMVLLIKIELCWLKYDNAIKKKPMIKQNLKNFPKILQLIEKLDSNVSYEH